MKSERISHIRTGRKLSLSDGYGRTCQAASPASNSDVGLGRRIGRKGCLMSVKFKEFIRSAFSGSTEDLKKAVADFCNSELKNMRVLSISEAKGVSDDFYKITVWYDDGV